MARQDHHRRQQEQQLNHTYKDESTTLSGTAKMTASIIDLSSLSTVSSRPTEANHRRYQQRQQQQSYGKLAINTLKKADEHYRSLFNLLPASLRLRHQHSKISNKKGIDTSTTTQPSPSIDIRPTDYDSGYMSQSFLHRTSSYASCHLAVAATMPISSTTQYGSIESLLHGHSKSYPANIRVIVRKNFEPFAQAQVAVTKGTIVTALFSRGPWLYVCIDSNGKTGYIPRIICSLYPSRKIRNNLSISSADSSLIKDDEFNLKKESLQNQDDIINSHQQTMNRNLSHSSTIINDSKQYRTQMSFDERERRHTYTLPRPPRSNLFSSKDRRLTVDSINYSSSTNKHGLMNRNHMMITTLNDNNNTIMQTRDTDSSSTQDSGYSESTSFYLVQQAMPDSERVSLYPISNISQKTVSTPHYATLRRSTNLKVSDSINPGSVQHRQINSTGNHRHTFLNGVSTNDTIVHDSYKRRTLPVFDTNQLKNAYKDCKTSTNNSINRLRDFALIRNVRQDKSETQSQQKIKLSIYNLPKSHKQIPASFFLNHHRRKQQFGSSHSAFRPVRPKMKHKRASSEGHSTSSSSSSSSSSISSSHSSLNVASRYSTRRRLSCDFSFPIFSRLNSNSLARSVCDQSSSKTLNYFSRTMSDILCDQFSDLNIDAIEKDSLINHQPKELHNSQQYCLFTIMKDYGSSYTSFSVQRGDRVHVLKRVGQACYLVRKPNNGQIGILPKAFLQPTASTRINTFLETHGYRETII